MTIQKPPGAASLFLVAGVAFLDEEESVFNAMLEGWSDQQRGGRNLKEATVRNSLSIVRNFQQFTNDWPWNWSAADFDEWMTHLVAIRHLAPSTIRLYQHRVREFCNFLCSEHYGWAEECGQRFGAYPSQVCHEWNSVSHVQESEGKPGRRPMSRHEIQALLDKADQRVEECIAGRRKGALAAYRDATILKVIYGWGLRINEVARLDLNDFYTNAHAPQFGRYGILHVRHGKSSAGSSPKRRSVLSLHSWAVEAVRDFVENIRPRMKGNTIDALWVTERGSRVQTQEIRRVFNELRDDLGLDEHLTPHCMRHSYVTHLVESGVDPTFVQKQVGHAYQSTTAIYTAVSGDFANKMMQEAIEKLMPRPRSRGYTQ